MSKNGGELGKCRCGTDENGNIEGAEKDEKGTQMVKCNKESRKKVVKSVRSVCRSVLLCELQ